MMCWMIERKKEEADTVGSLALAAINYYHRTIELTNCNTTNECHGQHRTTRIDGSKEKVRAKKGALLSVVIQSATLLL